MTAAAANTRLQRLGFGGGGAQLARRVLQHVVAVFGLAGRALARCCRRLVRALSRDARCLCKRLLRLRLRGLPSARAVGMRVSSAR